MARETLSHLGIQAIQANIHVWSLIASFPWRKAISENYEPQGNQIKECGWIPANLLHLQKSDSYLGAAVDRALVLSSYVRMVFIIYLWGCVFLEPTVSRAGHHSSSTGSKCGLKQSMSNSERSQESQRNIPLAF